MFDALTFWANGFQNVTCLFGTEGFTDELWEAVRKVQRVRIAYDADDAGERAAQRDAERFQTHGIEVFRVKFPHGMDANEYACKVKPADKSLALLLNAAQWLWAGGLHHAAAPPAEAIEPVAGSHRRHAAPAPSSLAASVSSSNGTRLKRKKPAAASTWPSRAVASIISATGACRPGTDAATLGSSTWKAANIAWPVWKKPSGTDALKIALRLRAGERFHLDQVDLCRDMERRRFVERAAEETGLTADLLKRDMGRLLLAVEQAQAELARPAEHRAPAVTLYAGGTRGGVALVARAEPDRAFAPGVPPGGHHRRGNQHARGVSGGRVAQTGTAAGHHHPERERGGQDHADGRGAVVLPGGGARQILAP